MSNDSKDHARHALEQALADRKISRGEYEELIGYVMQRMFTCSQSLRYATGILTTNYAQDARLGR